MDKVKFVIILYLTLPSIKSECEVTLNVGETKCGNDNIAKILGFLLVGIAIAGVAGLLIYRIAVFRKTGQCFPRQNIKGDIRTEEPIRIDMSVVKQKQSVKKEKDKIEENVKKERRIGDGEYSEKKRRKKTKQRKSKVGAKPYVTSMYQGQSHIKTRRKQFKENGNDHLRYVNRTRFDGAQRFYRGAEYYEDELDEQEVIHTAESRELEPNQRIPLSSNVDREYDERIAAGHMRYPGVAGYESSNAFSRGNPYEDEFDQYLPQIPESYAIMGEDRYSTPPPPEEMEDDFENEPETEVLEQASEHVQEEEYDETTEQQQYDM